MTGLQLPGSQDHQPGNGAAAWLVDRISNCPVRLVTAGYLLSALIFCAVLVSGRAGFVDLQVYRVGGAAVLHHWNLYGLEIHGMPFTYPPFAAVIFAIAAAVPVAVASVVLTAAGVVVLPVLLYLAMRLPPLRARLSTTAAWRIAFAAAAAAIWLEPVQSTLAYGQVNLVLAAVILYDLTLPATSRWKGLGIGLAAGIKLTPAIFAVYYLVTRRYRAAATSALTFAASVAVGFLILPGSSWHYWGGAFLNSSRVAQLDVGANESLAGALTRTLHTADVTLIWLPLAAILVVSGLVLAARAQRRGSEAAGFALCAVTGLLVSPVSWTHHWVIAVPALLIAAVESVRVLPRYRVGSWLCLAGIAALVVIGWTRVARLVGGDNWLGLSPLQVLMTEPYVIAGLLALAFAAWRAPPRLQSTQSENLDGHWLAQPARVSSKG